MRPRTMWRRGLVAVLLYVASAYAQATAPEYHVKAAFIYKFATYIRWPAVAHANANTPFVIGVLGKDPFGRVLHEVVRGQKVQGRTIVIKRFDRPEDAPLCAMVFISSSESGQLSEILASLRGTPVLTVSDIDRFAEMGGMIQLVTTADNHIHFAINKKAIDRADLKAPSQLLKLARIVDEPGPGGGN